MFPSYIVKQSAFMKPARIQVPQTQPQLGQLSENFIPYNMHPHPHPEHSASYEDSTLSSPPPYINSLSTQLPSPMTMLSNSALIQLNKDPSLANKTSPHDSVQISPPLPHLRSPFTHVIGLATTLSLQFDNLHSSFTSPTWIPPSSSCTQDNEHTSGDVGCGRPDRTSCGQAIPTLRISEETQPHKQLVQGTRQFRVGSSSRSSSSLVDQPLGLVRCCSVSSFGVSWLGLPLCFFQFRIL